MDLRKDILYYDALVDFPTNGQENKLYLNKADGALYYWDGSAYSLAGDGSGGVTSVTASAPLASSGGAIPNISLTIPSDNTKFLDGSGTFDTVKDSDLSLSDITTNDVSTSKHGFAPKAPNDTAKFLRGDGTWAVPAGGSSGIAVGTTAVTSGTIGRIFFQGTGNVVQQDSTLFWDNSNKRLGIGATPSTSVRLDVRAQGALSTDIAFRVRNSADTRNFLTVNGAGDVFNNGAQGVTSNTFYGENSGRSSTGLYNCFFGNTTGRDNSTGSNNSFFGVEAGRINTSGASNSFFGLQSGTFNTTGSFNSFFGNSAGLNSSTGGYNTFLGDSAGQNNTTASFNSCFGYAAGQNNSTGIENVFIGVESGRRTSSNANVTVSNNSVFLGTTTRANANSETNQIVIGHNAIGIGSNTAVLGNTSIVTTQLRGNVISGNQSALATTATDGFLYIPTCAGVPTGVPTAITGKVPMVSDTTNNKLYIYVGGAWTAMN